MAAVLKKRALAEYSQTIQVVFHVNTAFVGYIHVNPYFQDHVYQPPIKKLRLVKRPTTATGTSALTLLSCLESCKNSNDALKTLLRVSDSFELETSELQDAVKKLSDHFKSEPESAVRVKILSLLCDIGHEAGADVALIIEETIILLRNDHSHKVIAQGVNTILKLGILVRDNVTVLQKIVDIAKNYLKDISHNVKCKCLEIIAVHTPVCSGVEANKLLQLIRSYFNNDDARVRSQAFSAMITLHKRGFKLNPEIYDDVCGALKDDYEVVRKVVLELVWHLANTYPEK